MVSESSLVIAVPFVSTFLAQAPMYYRGANAALLLYDITNASSFDDVRGWLEGVQFVICDINLLPTVLVCSALAHYQNSRRTVHLT